MSITIKLINLTRNLFQKFFISKTLHYKFMNKLPCLNTIDYAVNSIFNEAKILYKLFKIKILFF